MGPDQVRYVQAPLAPVTVSGSSETADKGLATSLVTDENAAPAHGPVSEDTVRMKS